MCQQCKSVISVPPPSQPIVQSPSAANQPFSASFWFEKWWVVVLFALLGPLGVVILVVLYFSNKRRMSILLKVIIFLEVLPVLIVVISFFLAKPLSVFPSTLHVPPSVNLLDIDSDSDGVKDVVEKKIGTNPSVWECSEYLKNPCNLVTVSSEDSASKNLLVILDSSGSMAGVVGGKTKMEIAKEVLNDQLKSLSEKNYKIGLLVYGHLGSNSIQDKQISCKGVDVILPIGSSSNEISAAMLSFSPTGWTPIATSLNRAGEVMKGFGGQNNTVLLISDGEETCGGDPVLAARGLRDSDVKAVINVIGFDVDAVTKAQLESVAKVGGGRFILGGDEETFRKAAQDLTNVVENARSGFDARLCIAQEKHKLLQCLNEFYYTKVQPNINDAKEKSLLREKYDEIVGDFDRLTAPFMSESKEQLDESVEEISERIRDKYR